MKKSKVVFTMNKNQDKIKKIISIVLVILWCLLIFYFSNQKGSLSQENSDSIINLLNSFFKFFNANIDITNLEYISFIVRKSAHLFLYFVLYFLVYHTFYQFDIKKKYYLSLLFCFIYAVSDEIHQIFVPNRSFGPIDILIDTTGSYLASLVISIISFIKTCKKK